MVKKTDKLIIIYFFLSVIIFAFFASESSYMAQNIIVPYIKMSPLFIHLGLTIITLVFLIFFIKDKDLVFDIIVLFLCIRIASSIIPMTYISAATETAGRIIVPIISTLAYFIGRQYTGNLEKLVKLNMIFVTILSIQTIYTVQNMVVPHPSLYTQFVKIPLASSNLIAAYLTPSIFFVLTGYRGKWYIKYSIIIISIIALVASTSNGGILISIIMLILYILFFNKKISKFIKIFSTMAIFLGTLLYFVGNDASLSEITHGRNDLFMNDFSKWSDHLFFGNGMVYDDRGSGSHNILIDLLVQNGLFGFFLYLIPLLIVFKRAISNIDIGNLGLIMYLIAAFLHSLIETSYFNYTNDMLFWFFAGIIISYIRNENKKISRKNKNLLAQDYQL